MTSTALREPFDIERPATSVAHARWIDGPAGRVAGARLVAEETPVALVYDGSCAGVLMATPDDLEDFALGFSLTEGIVASAAEIRSLDILHLDEGIELRMWLADGAAQAHRARHRHLVGPTGCGLCGIESLAEAAKPSRRVTSQTALTAGMVARAVAELAGAQALNAKTRATHAAGFYRRGTGLVCAREDVGRHNALDKLGGGLARAGVAPADGAIVITSRVSVEMVQKTAALGAPVLIAISAPTALAIRTAEACGVTLVGIARGQTCEIFTHADRIV